MKYKLVLAAGHEQITDQIKKFDEVEVVEENGDIEIIEEVMEFVDADFAVINTFCAKSAANAGEGNLYRRRF